MAKRSHMENRTRAGEYARNEYSLAVTSKEEAIKRNEYFRAHGIAAEQEVRGDGERMALIYRTPKGEEQANAALGVFNRFGGQPRN